MPRIADLDGSRVLPRATEEEFTKAIAFAGIVASGASKDKSTGAVSKQSTKFARHAAGSEYSAVDVGGDDSDGLRLSRSNQRLPDGEGIEQAEAGAAHVHCAAHFSSQQTRIY